MVLTPVVPCCPLDPKTGYCSERRVRTYTGGRPKPPGVRSPCSSVVRALVLWARSHRFEPGLEQNAFSFQWSLYSFCLLGTPLLIPHSHCETAAYDILGISIFQNQLCIDKQCTHQIVIYTKNTKWICFLSKEENHENLQTVRYDFIH